MNLVYWVCHHLAFTLYDCAFRGEVDGLGHLPERGPFLMAVNHCSHLDPPIVGCHLAHQVSFFARKTLWKPGFASWWLDAVETIPVDRDGGSDVGALRRVLRTLEQGRVVILFPEGTRSLDGRLQAAKPGVGLIAAKSQVPVVPARIFGSFEALGRTGRLRLGTPVDVCFGRPLTPADYDRPADGRARFQRISERIMAAIAAIAPPVRPTV
jgi:1-acyl-sn-glycerol-3-phosphate acyltransferase